MDGSKQDEFSTTLGRDADASGLTVPLSLETEPGVNYPLAVGNSGGVTTPH